MSERGWSWRVWSLTWTSAVWGTSEILSLIMIDSKNTTSLSLSCSCSLACTDRVWTGVQNHGRYSALIFHAYSYVSQFYLKGNASLWGWWIRLVNIKKLTCAANCMDRYQHAEHTNKHTAKCSQIMHAAVCTCILMQFLQICRLHSR